MGFFGGTQDTSVVDEVENATSEKSVDEDWSIIINICDKAGKSSEDSKAYLKAIVKRLFNTDPHIGVKAVTLLDACVKNSGKTFHIEVASRDFENDFVKLMQKGHPTVSKKLRESLKRWAENEFKSDGQLSLIPSLYHKLKSTYDFSTSETPVKKSAAANKDPNVVESQEEEEQILKAIELSLKDTSGSPRTKNSSLYPSIAASAVSTGSSSTAAPVKEPRKVRALYDFEAAEDNELTFTAGEIIMVIDDSDSNWWKGSNQRGEGLFPANFVTADLSVEPEKSKQDQNKKSVQFKDDVKVAEKGLQEVEINESKIDQLLHLLHEADPTNPEKDTPEMLNLEREVVAMGPLIDSELERVDRKHAKLTKLSADLVEGLGLYHSLMKEPQFPLLNKGVYSYPAPSGSVPFAGTLPPQTMQPPPGIMNPPQHSLAHTVPGPPGLPPGVQERLPYQPPQLQHYSLPGMPHSSGMPLHQLPQPGSVLSGLQPRGAQQAGVSQHIPPQHLGADHRRIDNRLVHHVPLNMPNFLPPPGMTQPGYPQNSMPLQNGPTQQQPQYVSSSTDIIH
ncbi:signal transducing adapter molecule 1 [Cylas formicarius]|uniref:signal transducing adapter molecule 1 n=1 Tax=Cylas formicarius TaxID=197179 RepID=UPI002958DEB8|nr:signal transducing adapter molecule 1 [Cylas formicarius]